MKWALVLSGGGARGLAHIGVLKSLEAWGLKPSLVIGTSMGAIVGGIYACGTSISDIESFLLEEFEFKKYLDRWVFHLSGGPLVKYLQAQDALHSLLQHDAIDSGARVLQLLQRFTRNKDFSQTEIPFACNAVDLVSGREVLLNEGPVAEAIRASMSLPGIFSPVQKNDRLLVDGGILNNAPLWIAKKLGARRILCIHVSRLETAKAEDLTNGIAIFLRTNTITGNSLTEVQNRGGNALEIWAYNRTSVFDFDRKEELIQLGQLAAAENKDRIVRWLTRRWPFWA